MGIQTLRIEFKTNFDRWQQSLSHIKNMDEILPEIEELSIRLEQATQKKITLLESYFKPYHLSGEYLRSVNESFDDLEQFMRSHKTFLDIIKGKDLSEILQHIQKHYKQYFVPLLNILSKLENDYIAIMMEAISKKQDKLHEIQIFLEKLQLKRKKLNRFFVFNKKTKIFHIDEQIKQLDLKKRILQASLQHDKLNFYYFNHDDPQELLYYKEKSEYFNNLLRQLTQKTEESKEISNILEQYEHILQEFETQKQLKEKNKCSTHRLYN